MGIELKASLFAINIVIIILYFINLIAIFFEEPLDLFLTNIAILAFISLDALVIGISERQKKGK